VIQTPGLLSANFKINAIVESSDSVVLDDCKTWVNLAAEIITWKLLASTIIDLTPTL
jgi:hypothetical protein